MSIRSLIEDSGDRGRYQKQLLKPSEPTFSTSNSIAEEVQNFKIELHKSIIPDTCQKHQRPKEIICLNDKVFLCSHCAIFDHDEGHSFISLNDAKKQINQKLEQKKKEDHYYKEEYPLYITTEKEELLKKLNETKKQLIRRVKKAYINLYMIMEKQEADQYEIINQLIKGKEKALLQEFRALEGREFPEGSLSLVENIPTFYVENVLKQKTSTHEQEKQQILRKIQEIRQKVSVKEDEIKVSLRESKIVQLCQDCVCINIPEHKPKILVENNSETRLSVKDKKLLFKSESRVSVLSSTCQKHKNYENKLKNMTINTTIKSASTIVQNFIQDRSKQVLDLSNLKINNIEVHLAEVRKERTIPRLKLNRNNITDAYFLKLLPYLDSTESVNLSSNKLTEKALTMVLENLTGEQKLNMIHLSRNQINENIKEVKDRIAEVKNRLGVLIMI